MNDEERAKMYGELGMALRWGKHKARSLSLRSLTDEQADAIRTMAWEFRLANLKAKIEDEGRDGR